MTGTVRQRISCVRILAVVLAILTAVVIAPVGWASAARAGQPCESGGETRVVGPMNGWELFSEMDDLKAGDTLLLSPGTYDIGSGSWGSPTLRPCSADPAHRITVSALDPANPPLVRGQFRLESVDYWTFSNLRIQGTVAGQSSLLISGGVGWTLDHVEVFGAAQTGSYGNVYLNGSRSGGPRDFSVINSCIHDGGRKPHGDAGFHGIYVATPAVGDAASGVIANNIIFNHPLGAGIKLGSGGNAAMVGPWNVRVERNTIVNAQFGITFHGRLSNDSATGNLIGRSRSLPGSPSRKMDTAGVYLHQVAGSGNLVAGNYVFDLDQTVRTSGRNRVRVARSNIMRRTPRFVGQGCNTAALGVPARFGRRR